MWWGMTSLQVHHPLSAQTVIKLSRNLKWIYQELSRNVKEWWNDVGPTCGCNGVMTVAHRLMKEELKSFKTLIFLMEV